MLRSCAMHLVELDVMVLLMETTLQIKTAHVDAMAQRAMALLAETAHMEAMALLELQVEFLGMDLLAATMSMTMAWMASPQVHLVKLDARQNHHNSVMPVLPVIIQLVWLLG